MKNLYLKNILILIYIFTAQHTAYATPNTIRITLAITDSSNSIRTNRIVFSEGTGYTTGLDEGYDAGIFGGDAPGTGHQDRFGNNLAIYTLLVKDDLSRELGFTIQSLPYNQIGNMVIPLGINPTGDDTVIMKATITDFDGETTSFPYEHQLILEDKILGTYTELQELDSEYIVSLTQNEPELGRFYLHTTTDTAQKLYAIKAKNNNSKKSKSYRVFGCRDKKAKNYNRFSKHRQSKCEYQNDIIKKDSSNIIVTTEENNFVFIEKLCEFKYSRILKKGMKGEDIRQIQDCISSFEHEVGPIDGIFGNQTYSGIISYQKANGLLIDGIVGSQTANHINTKT